MPLPKTCVANTATSIAQRMLFEPWAASLPFFDKLNARDACERLFLFISFAVCARLFPFDTGLQIPFRGISTDFLPSYLDSAQQIHGMP
jgi:hypothetical protein